MNQIRTKQFKTIFEWME